jgi:hypothetical protein
MEIGNRDAELSVADKSRITEHGVASSEYCFSRSFNRRHGMTADLVGIIIPDSKLANEITELVRDT